MVLGAAVGLPVAEFGSVAALPDAALALFGAGLFDSPAWFAVVEAAGMPAGANAAYLVVGKPALAVLPMLRLAGRAGVCSLSTPYTCLWSLMTAPRTDTYGLYEVGLAWGLWCRAWPTVRLDAMDFGDARWAAVLRGARDAGLAVLRFNHFGDWTGNVAGLNWDVYLAGRPGALRSVLRRRGARLAAAGAGFRVVDGATGLAPGIAAFEHVYARSWKQREPFPWFNEALMLAAGGAGVLRLGLLERAGVAIAAQLWVVADGCATLLKMAYDEAVRAESAGTVLTGKMVAYLLERDRPVVLDFGRGDDAYKADWAAARSQRFGVLLARRSSISGAFAIARHRAGQLRRSKAGAPPLDPAGQGPAPIHKILVRTPPGGVEGRHANACCARRPRLAYLRPQRQNRHQQSFQHRQVRRVAEFDFHAVVDFHHMRNGRKPRHINDGREFPAEPQAGRHEAQAAAEPGAVGEGAGEAALLPFQRRARFVKC
jgi:hypothetical protein